MFLRDVPMREVLGIFSRIYGIKVTKAGPKMYVLKRGNAQNGTEVYQEPV
jgi:hypothetical protein